MTAYHFVAASERFLTVEEPLEEVLRERIRNYEENSKTIDFWLVRQPAFLEAPEQADVNAQLPKPAAAVISTDATFITFFRDLEVPQRPSSVSWGRHIYPLKNIRDATSTTSRELGVLPITRKVNMPLPPS